ncbi:MAG: hypothetical protein NC191_07225 [Muribaculaceae bacterium]|nr:hypothetical protein [Muribaculaceae bacterium]
MHVNFTGIKNIGYKSDLMYPTYEQDGKLVYNSNDYIDVNTINMQLRDDFEGKDLSNYRKVMAAPVAKDKRHPAYPNFLNVSVVKGELPSDKDTYFFLNGSMVDVNDENMPIFSFIAKTLKGLTQRPLEKFEVDPAYLFGDNVGKLMVLGQDLEDNYETHLDYWDAVADMHSNEHAQNGAKKMLELLEKKMFEYFDI